MWPFRKETFIDDDTAAWHIENFAWLMREFGRDGEFLASRLVLPNAEFFPTAGERGHDLALRLFHSVKEHCRMAHWPIRLVADDNPAFQIAQDTLLVQQESRVLGTFGYEGSGLDAVPVITYAPSLVDSPVDLIATLAHEMAHALLSAAESEPVCGEDEHEFLTDLAAVFMGFGVFLAATRFRKLGEGVGAIRSEGFARTGYLPENDLVFATALYLAVQGLEPEAAAPSLKPHMRQGLERSMRQLAGGNAVAMLAAIAAEKTDRPV